MNMKTSPSQKLGIEIPNRTNVEQKILIDLFLLDAANIPNGTKIIIPRNVAKTTNSTVAGKDSVISDKTVRPLLMLLPKSKRKRSWIYLRN